MGRKVGLVRQAGLRPMGPDRYPVLSEADLDQHHVALRPRDHGEGGGSGPGRKGRPRRQDPEQEEGGAGGRPTCQHLTGSG